MTSTAVIRNDILGTKIFILLDFINFFSHPFKPDKLKT